MGKESLENRSTDYIMPSFAEKILGKTILRPGSTFMSERILKHARIELPDDFLVEFVNAIDSKYIPILVANHASHADAVTSAKLVKLLIYIANRALPEDEQMDMFTLPLAASLESGHQGGFLRQVYLGSKPVIEDAGLWPNPITRPKDKKSEKEGGYGMEQNLDTYRNLHRERLEKKPNGTVLYPETTTTGGSTDINGIPHGMIPFEGISIRAHEVFAKRYSGRTPMLIYAGIMGSTSAIDPNTKRVPIRALNSMINPDQYHIKVGGIIKTDDPEYSNLRTNEEINEFVGRKIASQLPPEMRGVYA